MSAPSNLTEQQFTVEIGGKETTSLNFVGTRSDDMRPIVNGEQWRRWKSKEERSGLPSMGVRDKWVSPDGYYFMKSEPYKRGQNEQEVSVWNAAIANGDDQYFVPILAHGIIQLTRKERWSETTDWADRVAYFSWIIQPYMTFHPHLNPGMSHLLSDRANTLAANYGIGDWDTRFNQFRQYKPIDGGTSFIIHDYPGSISQVSPSNLTQEEAE